MKWRNKTKRQTNEGKEETYQTIYEKKLLKMHKVKPFLDK